MFDYNPNSKFIFEDDSDGFNYVEERVCQRCKMSLSDFYRANIVGCSNCYKVFENEIKQVLLRNQGAVNHIGKVPETHVSKAKLREKIALLSEQKKVAAEEEDFMRAEVLKNHIEKLKGELDG